MRVSCGERTYLGLLALALKTREISSSIYNYGVYFDETGPFPYGVQNPVIGSDLTDSKAPTDWRRVKSMYYPFDWSVYFTHFDGSDFEKYTMNKCRDNALAACEPNCNYFIGHEQSPIQVQHDPQAPICDDRHSFHYPLDGTCNEGEISFKVTPTGLRADMNCTERPNLDFSRNGDSWEMRAIEVKVPAEHEHRLENGTVLQFDAELQMVHTGTGLHDDDFAIVAVWLQASGDTKNAELEKYIEKWEAAIENQYFQCNKTFVENACGLMDGYIPNNRTAIEWELISSDDFEEPPTVNFVGGSNTLRSKYQNFATSGNKSYRIRYQGNSARFYHKINYDITEFNALQIRFAAFAKNVRHGDGFALDYSNDGGRTFHEVQAWQAYVDIDVNENTKEGFTNATVVMTRSKFQAAFTDKFRLAFRSSTSSKSRRFYIDDIDFFGYAGPLALIEMTDNANDINVTDSEETNTNTSPDFCTEDITRLCCSTQGSSAAWQEITNDDFEAGWGNFYTANPQESAAKHGVYSRCDGSKCVRLRDERNYFDSSAFYHYQDHDVTTFSQLQVDFQYQTYGFDDGSSDGFALDFSSDGGTSWIEVEVWTMETLPSNVNDVPVVPTQETLNITKDQVDFTQNARLRFRSINTSPSDQVYIDNVIFSGYFDPASVCSQNVTDACCGRRLTENSSFLRGKKPESKKNNKLSKNTASSHQVGPKSREERGKFRKLEDETGNGYLCDDSEDYFCPYNLFRQTENPYYHRYYGSLTSPPCTEKVSWRVMIEPLIISKGQLKRLEDLVSKYLEYPTCTLQTWGKPRMDGTCHVDVNRPVQYLSEYHRLEDCEENHDGGSWVFESVGLELDSSGTEPSAQNKTDIDD